MMVKVFTLCFDPALGGFDDSAMREFLKDRRVLTVENHFFSHDHTPYLCLVVSYEAGTVSPAEQAATEQKKRDNSWKKLLGPDDMPLFNTLRDWRIKIARKEGIPPYVVATNRQLAVMVRDRPQTRNALGRIEGFGAKKITKYADELLSILRIASQDEPQIEQEPETDPGQAAGEEHVQDQD